MAVAFVMMAGKVNSVAPRFAVLMIVPMVVVPLAPFSRIIAHVSVLQVMMV